MRSVIKRSNTHRIVRNGDPKLALLPNLAPASAGFSLPLAVKICWGGRPPYGIECARVSRGNSSGRRPPARDTLYDWHGIFKACVQLHG